MFKIVSSKRFPIVLVAAIVVENNSGANHLRPSLPGQIPVVFICSVTRLPIDNDIVLEVNFKFFELDRTS